MDCAKVWLSKERAERKDASCPICRTVSAIPLVQPHPLAAPRFDTGGAVSAAGRGAAECHLEGEGTCRERLSGGDVCYESKGAGRGLVCLDGHQWPGRQSVFSIRKASFDDLVIAFRAAPLATRCRRHFICRRHARTPGCRAVPTLRAALCPSRQQHFCLVALLTLPLPAPSGAARRGRLGTSRCRWRLALQPSLRRGPGEDRAVHNQPRTLPPQG